MITEDYCYNLHGQRWINENGTVYKCTEFCEKEQEEQKPVDLEEEIRKYLEPITCADIRIEPFNSLERCARHFYELGKKGGSK